MPIVARPSQHSYIFGAHALSGEPDVRHPREQLAVGEDIALQRLRPARRGQFETQYQLT